MFVYYAGWLNAKAGRLADRSGRRDKMLKSGTVPPKTGRMVSLPLMMIVDQIFNGVSSTAMLVSPSVCAALWFPENEVGSAIGINVMSFYLGQTFAFTVLTKVLIQPPNNHSLDANVTVNQSWLVQDQWKL